jgi:hypothetical protein
MHPDWLPAELSQMEKADGIRKLAIGEESMIRLKADLL